jgi:hypothetical protein
VTALGFGAPGAWIGELSRRPTVFCENRGKQLEVGGESDKWAQQLQDAAAPPPALGARAGENAAGPRWATRGGAGCTSALGRGRELLAAQGGSGVGLGRGSWAARCGAGKRALASGLGWPGQASRPGKETERGGRRNCAGLAGEGKEVELGLFIVFS